MKTCNWFLINHLMIKRLNYKLRIEIEIVKNKLQTDIFLDKSNKKIDREIS